MDVELHTERLLLRPPRLEDLTPLAEMLADPETARHIGGVQSRHGSWRILMSVAGSWRLNGFAMFSVIERATGKFIGRLGPWQPDGWPGTEIGWSIVRNRWGEGFATEGAAAAADWAFDHLGWTEMIHVIAPDNPASQAVARKLGSRNRGPGQLRPRSRTRGSISGVRPGRSGAGGEVSFRCARASGSSRKQH